MAKSGNFKSVGIGRIQTSWNVLGIFAGWVCNTSQIHCTHYYKLSPLILTKCFSYVNLYLYRKSDTFNKIGIWCKILPNQKTSKTIFIQYLGVSSTSLTNPAPFLQINDWKHPQILHHNLVLICLLLHQGQAPTWCLRWWVGEWLSAALHEGAAWCQGDAQKKKGQEGMPPSLHTKATICSETLPVGDSVSSSQPPMELSVHLPCLQLTCCLL